jgi:hypothetical protein
MRDALAEVGLHLMYEEEAEKRLAEIRQLYEPFVHALADHLLVNLPPWIVLEKTVDDWQTSAWDHFAQWSPQKLEEITHIIVDHRKKVAAPHTRLHSHSEQGERHSHDGDGRVEAS